MTTGDRIAQAARDLVGTPFRLHGRDPATGLDCVGVAFVALDRAGLRVRPPHRYSLHNRSIANHLAVFEGSALNAATLPYLPGDMVLTRPGAAQHHVLVAIGPDLFVHAHAGIRRVALTSGGLPWPVLHHWRAHSKG